MYLGCNTSCAVLQLKTHFFLPFLNGIHFWNLPFRKLIRVLQQIVCSLSNSKEQLLFRTMKCLQYIMRFVARSRTLYTELYPEDDSTDDFDYTLKELLRSIVVMQCNSSDLLLREQGACLKFLPSTIPDILSVFNAKELRFANFLWAFPNEMLKIPLQLHPPRSLWKYAEWEIDETENDDCQWHSAQQVVSRSGMSENFAAGVH